MKFILNFYAPVSKDWGDIVFGLSVRLSVCKNFNIGHIFWMVSDRTFIFHMCIPYDKTFLLVPKFLTLWSWTWSLTHFSKTLPLAISFECQVIGLSYFICVFLMTRPFYWYHIFWPCDLKVWPTFKNFNIDHIFNGKSYGFHISYVCSLWQELSNDTRIFDLVTLTLKFDPLFKNFHFGHIFWMVSDGTFVFHMHATCDKTFILEP
jgi:hypothetical protein